ASTAAAILTVIWGLRGPYTYTGPRPAPNRPDRRSRGPAHPRGSTPFQIATFYRRPPLRPAAARLRLVELRFDDREVRRRASLAPLLSPLRLRGFVPVVAA